MNRTTWRVGTCGWLVQVLTGVLAVVGIACSPSWIRMPREVAVIVTERWHR